MALYETLQYTVIHDEGQIQIREYDNILLASTKTPINKYQDSGFNNVFQYISGNNKSNTKISMTTPVVTYESDEEIITGFYVPSKYNKETVPEPASSNVFINEITKSLFAVIQFRGTWNKKNYDKHDQLLQDYISKNNYNITSVRYVFRYQPPFVPGVFRRNEIAYQITSNS